MPSRWTAGLWVKGLRRRSLQRRRAEGTEAAMPKTSALSSSGAAKRSSTAPSRMALAMPLDELFDPAIDYCQGANQARGARAHAAPARAFVARGAQHGAESRERACDVSLTGVEDVHAEMATPDYDRPDRRRVADAHSIVGGLIARDTAEVVVRPVLSGPMPAVITATPPTRRRIASLSEKESDCEDSSGMLLATATHCDGVGLAR
jgi:hypothetical protein